MKTLLLNLDEARPRVLETNGEPSLDFFYRHIGCDFIDIAVRNINGKRYTIIVDDEGLFQENPKISAVDSAFQPMLVGNLLFYKAEPDEEGGLVGLSDEDIEHIKGSIVPIIDREYNFRSLLTQCEY